MAKSFQHLRFPWRFNERFPFLLIPLSSSLESELSELKEGFQYAIRQTMQAIAEEDSKFLSRILEPELFHEVSDGIAILKRRNHRIKLVNTDSFSYTYLYNEKLYCGVNIDRKKNSVLQYVIEQPSWVNPEKQKIPMENIEIYYGPERNSNLILKVDIIFNSAFKLVVHDEHDQLIIGENNKVPENHKFRFETLVERGNGMLWQFKSVIDILKYFVYGMGKSPFELDNWTLSDLDDFLNGNGFIQGKEE